MEVSQWRHYCGWLQHNQTIHCPVRFSWFFTTSTISGILANNVSFQYWIPRSGGYRKTTETSTKYSKVHQAFSCPYHWPRQCGEDNHPPASLQYNRTAENFQSGGWWGIPCSRHHHLTFLMWIDWLVWAQSNCTGNVDLQSLVLYWMCGREGSMILRMKWYLRVTEYLSFMTHVALKQAEHLSWMKWRTLCKNVQQSKSSGSICMWFGEWLNGNIKVHLNKYCVGTAFQSMKPDQLQGQS